MQAKSNFDKARCSDGVCARGWAVSVVLREFVGAQLALVYGDAEAGAEGDVEAAVAQGGRQVRPLAGWRGAGRAASAR